MSSDNLSFLDDGQSIASTVSQLHHYFKKTYSRYQVKQSDLVSRLHSEADESGVIHQELHKLDEVLALFGILSDSLSVANRVLHSEAIAKTLATETDLYKIHLEDEAEQAAEREAAQRKVAQQRKE